jgi:hypothetical protein
MIGACPYCGEPIYRDGDYVVRFSCDCPMNAGGTYERHHTVSFLETYYPNLFDSE